MKKALLLLILPTLYFGFITPLWSDNPAMVFDNPRQYIDLSDFQMSVNLDQNLFSLSDINDMAKGESVVLDKSKLELLEGGFNVSPVIYAREYIGFGTKSLKFGMNSEIYSNVKMMLPYELMQVIFGDIEMNETKESTFNMFKGGVFAKVGGLFGLKIGDKFSLAFSGGAYLPMIWFDENSKAHFYYESDENTATLRAGIDGSVRLLSAMSNLQNPDVDFNSIADMVGYYAGAGAIAKFGKLELSAAVNNISITPAKLDYEGFAKVSFEASLVNLKMNQSEPEMNMPEELSKLPESVEVKLPMEITAAISYKLSFFDLGAHFKMIPEMSKEFGFYADIAKVLWLDMTNIGSAWKKSLGLNLDLRFIRFTASAGVIDYGGILNFDPSKMTGLSVSAGFGIGF